MRNVDRDEHNPDVGPNLADKIREPHAGEWDSKDLMCKACMGNLESDQRLYSLLSLGVYKKMKHRCISEKHELVNQAS